MFPKYIILKCSNWHFIFSQGEMELIEGIFLSQTFTTTVACCLKHVLQGQSLYRKGYMNWQVSSLLQVVEEEIERSMDKMK